MKKRKYKIYPDFSERDWGWIAKVYERSGWFGMWKCLYESELYFGMEPWVKRLYKVASSEECHTTWKVYDARNRLIEKEVFV